MLKRLASSNILTQILNLIQPKHIKMANCEKVFVRNVAEEDFIQISFKYLAPPTNNSKIRTFNFNRPKTEELEKSLQRISGNITREMNRKLSKKKKSSVDPNDINGLNENLVNVELLDAKERPIDGLSTNSHAWNEAALLTVGNTRYSIELNAPTVITLSLPSIILSEFPLLPKLSLEFANEEDCQITWFIFHIKEGFLTDKRRMSVAENWIEIAKGKHFVPSKEFVGHFLKVSCRPKIGERSGEEVSFVSKDVILEGPFCPFEKRQMSTKPLTDLNIFRVISYNLLADLYADSDFSRDVLFPYCPPQYLHIDYRKHLIIKELLGYNSDILCLQEVDRKLFKHDLMPILRDAGFDGMLKLKMGEVAEGCATFYRRSKFRLMETYDAGLTEILQGKSRTMRDLLEQISTKPSLLEKVLERKTILQVSLFQDIESERHLLVATTHLFFHPDAAHIRLIQVYICIIYIQELLKKLRAEKSLEPALIFCGDFNASIMAAVHEFLLARNIQPNHPDWATGGPEEYIPNLHISHNLHLSNSSGFPQYTNYVKGFNACLDYIYTCGLMCKFVIPMPSHEDVEANVALPNQYFPSDHIAIGCDLTWNPEV